MGVSHEGWGTNGLVKDRFLAPPPPSDDADSFIEAVQLAFVWKGLWVYVCVRCLIDSYYVHNPFFAFLTLCLC